MLRISLCGGAARQRLLGCGWRDQGGHFADHGQDEALVAVGQRGAEALDFAEEADFVLREFAEHFLRLAVARRFRAGEKVGERNVHGFGDFRQRLERRHGVPVLHAREIAAQQAGAALDVALRQSALAAVGFDDFADVYAWLFFWHVDDPLTRGGSLVTDSRGYEAESAARD